MLPGQFITQSMRDQRIARVLAEAINGADPAALVSLALKDVALPDYHRLYLLGLGKAADRMTRAAASALGNFEAALVITKQRTTEIPPQFVVLEAGHPIPDQRSLAAGRAALEFASRPHEDDLLLCLISGGGSALATAPVEGVTLVELQQFTESALASGATIEEINVLRRQLDKVKGGGLAAATKASVLSLILSDVIGDRLESIASGPTAPNPTGPDDALAVLRKVPVCIPPSVDRAIRRRAQPVQAAAFTRVQNLVIGNNSRAVASAMERAKQEGFQVTIHAGSVEGEAQDAGRALAKALVNAAEVKRHPFCILAGGETTVTLKTHGTGGRNQELALSAVDILDGVENSMLIALATDGNDGPTDAAGAVVTGASKERASRLGLDVADHLARHDAYPFFDALGDLVRPGYTGTNVNDITFLFGL